MPLLTIQALWIGVIIGLLSRTYTRLLGTLAMTNWFLMLKKGPSTILYHTSFFTKKFECSPGSTENFKFFLQGGFVTSDIVFRCDDSTYNPRHSKGIEFAHSIFRLYNPAVQSFREALQRGSIKHDLVYEEWQQPHI